MKNTLMLLTLSVLTMGLQAKNDKEFRATHILRVHEQDGIRFRFNGKRITQKEVITLQQTCGFDVVDKYPKFINQSTVVTPVDAPKKVWKVVKLHEQTQAPVRVSGVDVLQAMNQLTEANKSDANIRKGAAVFLEKQARITSTTTSSVKPLVPTINPNMVHIMTEAEIFAQDQGRNIGATVLNSATESMPAANTFTTASAVVRSALTSPVAKLGGLATGFTVLGVAAYKYNQYLDEKAEVERLANRSYFEKAYDSVSDFAKSAKINTWDSNYGFNHSGKVATVASVAAVAGLSYLAYKKNPFGKVVVKTDEPKTAASTPVVAKRRIVSAT